MTRRTCARLLQWIAIVVPLSGGCDDITTGQPGPTPGPPKLTRITVQDVRALEGAASPAVGLVQRNSVVDLLDTGALQSCSDINPCVGQYTIDYTIPDFTCANGSCPDPLRLPSTGVPLSVPLGVNGDAGSGMQVRVVFSKLLVDSLETVTMDPTQPPGKTNTYSLKPGIAELDDDTGAEVPCVKLYDNTGVSNVFPSDVMIAPFGPAIVLKPKAPLLPATKYTIKLDAPAQLVDAQGNAAVGPSGDPLGAAYSIDFTTEALTANPGGSFPDFSTMPAKLTPNQLLQFAFWEPIDPTTATVTLMGPAGATALAYADQGGDATMCTANPWLLDVVNAPGGTPADWPAGSYTISIAVKDASGKSSASLSSLQFTVAGTAMAMDPEDWRVHPAPAQCK